MNSCTIIRRFVVVLLALALGGCQAKPVATSPTPAPPSTTASAPTGPAIDYRKLNALLDSGLYALDDDRLLTPIDNCAYDYFRAALALAPEDERALAGLERIVERYLELAEKAIAGERWATARTLLGRASIVDPDHAGVAQLDARIDLLRRASREHIALDPDRVTMRDEELRAELASIGTRVKRPDVQVTIVARNDEEGRWIYRALRDSPGEVRIQVQIEIGPAPALDLLTLRLQPDASP